MKKYARPQFIPTPIPADRRHDGRCRQESRRPMQQTALRPDPARCRPMATKRRCAGSEGVSLRITVTFVPPLQKNETEPNPAGFGSASSGRRRITSSVPSSRSAPSSQACGRGIWVKAGFIAVPSTTGNTCAGAIDCFSKASTSPVNGSLSVCHAISVIPNDS